MLSSIEPGVKRAHSVLELGIEGMTENAKVKDYTSLNDHPGRKKKG